MNVIEIAVRASTGDLNNCDYALDCLHNICKAEYRNSDIKIRKQARDRFIMECADILGADNPDKWTLANRILQAVRRFGSSKWPRILAGASETLCPSETALHRAFATGASIPNSERFYWNLLKLWR